LLIYSKSPVHVADVSLKAGETDRRKDGQTQSRCFTLTAAHATNAIRPMQ